MAAVLLLVAGAAWAQGSLTSPAARGGQFVFVVDDSRSMRERLTTDRHPAADPDRLAVFAVRSMLSFLDDDDEASVVRLNAAREGESAPPVAPLAEARGRLAGMLESSGELAHYGGDYTPCRSALEETRRILNQAQRQNVAQVVFFLTDGQCTPQQSDSEVPDPEAFLAGVRSHEHGLFRFYLLRFEGRPYSPELEQLARLTGGQAITVSGGEPTAILEPFADALTRSQGYEAEVLTPAEPELVAYRGARRVRLLAVAEGDGPDLQLRVADLKGQGPQLLGKTVVGEHTYKGAKTYRYAAVSYVPTKSAMTVQVEGAQGRWKVVAVPEYRLAVQMQFFEGPCDAQGRELRQGVESGQSVCAVIRLVNDHGRPVERAGVGEVAAKMRYRGVDGKQQELPANSRGELAEFTFERLRLAPGDYVFEPLVRLTLPGKEEPVTIRGPARLLEASSLTISPHPASVDFGTLLPGAASPPVEIRFDGNYPAALGRLQVRDRRSLPPCVTFSLSGRREEGTVSLGESVDEGTAPEIRAGGRYTLVAEVAPYCGLTSFRESFHPILQLLVESPETGPLATVEVGASLLLDYQLTLPADGVSLTSKAGEATTTEVTLGGNQQRPFEITLALEPEDERRGWPRGDLDLGVAAGGSRDDRSGGHFVERAVLTVEPASPEGGPILWLHPGRCCAEGRYETRLAVLPGPDAVYGGQLPEPGFLTVVVEVEGAGFWACRGDLVVTTLLLVLLLLLLLYAYSMWRSSTFLDRSRLAERLVPLRWDGYGDVKRDGRNPGEVRALVDRALGFRQRAVAWLKANPLVFALPGHSYRETVELSLQPSRQVDRSSLLPIGERDFRRRLEAAPERGAGRLFAQALGGGEVEFFGVPQRGRFGRLVPKRLQHQFSWDAVAPSTSGAAAEVRPKLVRLRRREQLIHPIPDSERGEGNAAGWQVG